MKKYLVLASLLLAGCGADDNARINDLETELSAFKARLETLETKQPLFSTTSFYATDLFFMYYDADGSLDIPELDGNQSEASSTATHYAYSPVPGLNDLAFEVTHNNTTVLIHTTGEAYITSNNAWAKLDVAVSIDGNIPAQGATASLEMVSDDTMASARSSWNISVPVQLDAGAHRFAVLVRGSEQNETTMALDGRSSGDFPGKIKASVMQVFNGNE